MTAATPRPLKGSPSPSKTRDEVSAWGGSVSLQGPTKPVQSHLGAGPAAGLPSAPRGGTRPAVAHPRREGHRLAEAQLTMFKDGVCTIRSIQGVWEAASASVAKVVTGWEWERRCGPCLLPSLAKAGGPLPHETRFLSTLWSSRQSQSFLRNKREMVSPPLRNGSRWNSAPMFPP